MRKKKVEADEGMTRREQAKAALLQAAARLFAERDDVTVRDIAEAAGLNHALVHYYFGSKEALRDAAFLHAAGQATAAMALSPTASAEEIARAVFAVTRTHPYSFLMGIREQITTDVGASRAARRPTPVASAVMACLRDPTDPAAIQAVAAASALLVGFVVQRQWIADVLKFDDAGMAQVQALAEQHMAGLLRPHVRGAS